MWLSTDEREEEELFEKINAWLHLRDLGIVFPDLTVFFVDMLLHSTYIKHKVDDINH